MQLIDCPWCGPREENEFGYGGEAHIAYPENPAELDDTEWAHYVFFRDNPQGAFAERWVHTVGCRRWFNAVRDTVTYRFLAVYPIGAPRPDVPVLAPRASAPAAASPDHDAHAVAALEPTDAR
ncbi:sarcosine oxidase subunit delta [Pseudoclavibacter chungangensis]|uniref:Sarcosine oxidase subunit delta n=1 Tax=Pseudoclavibacter chungangensis TaxID=587635 RepID=A0A7J5C0T1_9MICO|nr:sarcosine oxidase subunit delta [Pseudoclavibacter chungangensis]KAB1660346.1 sarcosine oxidase subunit delta [Pseudoclavibacter chungangensis]NYJ65705.1 heterotetrameric sarcosine oxidase delta subunit [Pseudoclavibacter chungangensis]